MSIKHLDKLVICHIDCSIWSGRKKLRPEDFRLPDGTQLPPSEVASLGSKKICDPEALNHFERLKKEAQRQCELVGVKFLGGYAIPESLINSIMPELDRIGQEFMHHKHLFLANYDTVTRGWVEKHPNFAEAIARAISPIQDVQERFQFNYTLYRMKPAKQKAELENKVATMGQTLFSEIARDANELFRLSIAGKDQLSQRAINPLRRMHNKLDGLSFLDSRVQPVVDTLDNLIKRFPSVGAVTGSLFHEAVSTVLMLTDPDKLKLHAENYLNPSVNPELSAVTESNTSTKGGNTTQAATDASIDQTTESITHDPIDDKTDKTTNNNAKNKANNKQDNRNTSMPAKDTGAASHSEPNPKAKREPLTAPKKPISHYF